MFTDVGMKWPIAKVITRLIKDIVGNFFSCIYELVANMLFCRILHRLNSWSRIDVTFEMFQTICASHQITPRFLNFVLGLGRKFTSWDEDFMSCYSCISPSNRHKASRKNKHSKAMEDSPAAGVYYRWYLFAKSNRHL